MVAKGHNFCKKWIGLIFYTKFSPLPLAPFAGPLSCIFFAFWTNLNLAVILKHVALKKIGLTYSWATSTLPNTKTCNFHTAHKTHNSFITHIHFCGNTLFQNVVGYFTTDIITLLATDFHLNMLTYFLRVKYVYSRADQK